MNTDLVAVQQMMDKAISKEMEMTKPSLWLSLKNGIMTFNGEMLPGNQADVVILAHVFNNILYLAPYNGEVAVKPDCSAIGVDVMTLKPGPEVTDPVSTECNSCPYNIFGSSGKGKRCKNTMKLAFLPVSPKGLDSSAELRGVKIPVTSVQNFMKYVRNVTTSFRRPTFGVVTRLKTAPSKFTFGLNFDVIRPLELSEVGEIYPRIKDAEEFLIPTTALLAADSKY